MLTLLVDQVQTPTGPMWLVTDEQVRVRALDWDQPRLLQRLSHHYGNVPQPKVSRAPQAIRHAIDAYFAGELDALDHLETYVQGTAFQQAVWHSLRTIQVGSTLSYGRLAAQIGRPRAVRAVGLANGQNPIGIVLPCHRVIGADGSLTGYGGGLERKRWLLRHEGALQ